MGVPGENLSEQSREPTNSTYVYGIEEWNQTQATLVESQCSCYCTNPTFWSHFNATLWPIIVDMFFFKSTISFPWKVFCRDLKLGPL